MCINIKDIIYHDTYCSLAHYFCAVHCTYLCITCTVHRTVISIEHLATASAGFFVLLASLSFRERKKFYTVKFKTNLVPRTFPFSWGNEVG